MSEKQDTDDEIKSVDSVLCKGEYKGEPIHKWNNFLKRYRGYNHW